MTRYRLTILLCCCALCGVAKAQEDALFEKKLRIISLAPATTEILFALGADDEIVGVSQFCNYPAAALTKEKTGTFSAPDIEKIIFLKPDVIFCTGLEQAETVHNLRLLGFNVCVSDPKNFDELFASITLIAERIHKNAAAEALVADMKKKIRALRARAAQKTAERKQKVFIEIWHDPLVTAGRASFLHELINLAGGENIAGVIPGAYGMINPELVIAKNPDCIILAYMQTTELRETIQTRLGWAKIAAVRNNRIYADIDPDLFLRPGPRAVLALENIHERLYPDEPSS
ncbi:MAG: cobalamin-binding protein [Candidatus Omnitrophica bacterium]|nr:cobalamin-binding protein [Candidatus Omnitrophota bacterium]MDD5574015.1 cobalamin-binding protein [Candidatus Omnitrophota bacterium]